MGFVGVVYVEVGPLALFVRFSCRFPFLIAVSPGP